MQLSELTSSPLGPLYSLAAIDEDLAEEEEEEMAEYDVPAGSSDSDEDGTVKRKKNHNAKTKKKTKLVHDWSVQNANATR